MVLLEEIDDEDVSKQQPSEHPRFDVGADLANEEEDDSDNKTNNLKERAKSIILSAQADPETLPSALNELLTDIIKPLFSATKHPELTSTGRKVTIARPPTVGRFQLDYDSIFDNTLPWKTDWTTTLLSTIIRKHSDIESVPQRKSSIESNFHLLIPAILNQIDAPETKFKVAGCNNLTGLCALLTSTKSEMMQRTGLTEVFIEALKKYFSYLPTLTPEDESLQIMEAVYPAWFGVVEARFVNLTYMLAYRGNDENNNNNKDKPVTAIPSLTSHLTTTTPKNNKTPANPSASQISSDVHTRQSLLTTLLRHSLLYSLNHLSSSPGGPNQGTSSISPKLTAFFISQIPNIVNFTGIYAAANLQYLLPILKQVLLDPFALTTISAPSASEEGIEVSLLISAVEGIISIIEVCWPRVRERWWAECLEALIGCWINTCDEEEQEGKATISKRFDKVREILKRAARVLESVMALGTDGDAGDMYGLAIEEVVAEDDRLVGLFEHGR